MALKPTHFTHTEAAVIPFGGTTAWHFLKKAAIKSGQKVLIVGASGAVGTAAIQLAKVLEARVTAVCSAGNIDLVKSLGADQAIDYTQEDFTQNGEIYDVIFDTVKTISISRSLKSLNEQGTLILSAAGMSEMFQGLWISMTSTRKVLTGVTSITVENINFLKDMMKTGQLKPVIDKTYPLEQMAEAHAYVEKGHKKGNLAITVNP
jgi:NADPH:quinone reductase-like Zn-dependent oxidoreductase